MPAVPIINAAKFPSRTDRPVHGNGLDTKFFFNFINQVEGIARLTIHFIDKCKDRDAPHNTDLKQLSGLLLNAFGRVNDHYGRVSRHQSAVGILRKILMSGCVQDINTAIVIVKLQNRRSNRDASLLFDLHPVRNCMLGCPFALNRACKLDCSSV